MLPSRQAAPLVWQSADGNDALAGFRDDACTRLRRDRDDDGVLTRSFHRNNDEHAHSRDAGSRNRRRVCDSSNLSLFHRYAYFLSPSHDLIKMNLDLWTSIACLVTTLSTGQQVQ